MQQAKEERKIFRLLLIPLLLIATMAKSQEPIGLMNDNYMPSSSILYNPASSFTSPVKWDLNIVSAAVYGYNNLAYAEHSSVLTLLGNSNIHAAAFNTPNTIRVFTNAMVQGPSVVFHQNTFSFGVITQVRSGTSLVTRQTPSNLDFNNLVEDSLYRFPQSNAAGMNWMQIGINLGKSIKTSGNFFLYSGININYLAGWDGIAATTQQSVDFIKHSVNDTLSFSQVMMNYGYTSGFGNDVQQNLTSFQFKGSGAGADGGIWITDSEEPLKYKWKAGVSLIDVGVVSFSKNIERYELTTDSPIAMDIDDLKGVASADEFTQLASQAVAGNGSLAPVSGPLRIWLPAALVFQGEVALPQHFFIQGLAVQRIILSSRQVLRPNSITVTPRYETKQFAAGIPIDWNDYHRVQLGGYVRVGPVLLGTDNLAALFIPAKWEGADCYLGVHLHPFGEGKNTRYQSGQIYCPKF
ncbi:MAG TPA: DUF5723 family protein [Chitinophagales bacterium]|nr:DUF5723 family protein [Chitinophagales bacterium]